MAQQYWWKPAVVSMPSMRVGSGVRGGLKRVDWGQVGFALSAFPDEPPETAEVDLAWGLDSANTLHLFDGQLYRRRYGTRQIDYDVFEPEYDTKVLTEGVAVKDAASDPDVTVYQPLVIGTVQYMTPQRTGTKAEQKYYMPDFATYDFYDDGVLINDHWTISGGYAERSVDLVGSLTASGTGNMTTLNDVFSWAAGEMGLSYVNVHSGEAALNCVITSQMFMVDLLDALAFYCCYHAEIKDGTLYLIDMNQDNGEQDLPRLDSVEITYEWPMQVKEYKAEWAIKEFDPEVTNLVDQDREAVVYPGSSGGDKVSITPYDQEIDDVTAKLEAISTQEAKPIVHVSLPLDRLPSIGEKITFTDRKPQHNISGYLRVGTYDLNYQAKTLGLQGRGDITFA